MNGQRKIMAAVLAGVIVMVALTFASSPVAALSDEDIALGIDGGDTTWIIVAMVLVFIMVPGVGFFYGGMLRKESVLSMLGQCLAVTALVTVFWVVIGYTLAFGSGGAIVGSLDHFFLKDVGAAPYGYGTEAAGTIPQSLFMLFQMMFCIVTTCLLTGGIAERMKLRALAIFLAIWSVLVYAPVAHWVWGGGWIMTELGALDFAGGTVVHIASGVSVLAAALVIGKRISVAKGHEEVPHNVPMAVLGAALLWFGWFGFNGGSALGTGSFAANALVNTQIAAAVATGVWGLISWLHLGRPSVMGLITGAIAGLVGITPAAGFVDASGAIAIGIGAAFVCYGGLILRRKLKLDDAVDVWGVHGLGGTFGAIATGFLASTAAGSPVEGLLYGGTATVVVNQVLAVAAVWAFVFVVTFAILKIMSLVGEIRMTKDEERIGADIVQHGERAYN